jgi:glycosyltransferase involved in cell wall biosynthesis
MVVIPPKRVAKDIDVTQKPDLSIVIPTRNRHECLRFTVAALLASKSKMFEVVVHDNSDVPWTDAVEGVVRSDDRLKYTYVNRRLSIVENCDRAVSLAQGQFVCMIGDDDGVLIDESLEVVQKLREAGFEAAIAEAPYFAWPNVRHSTWGDLGGAIFLNEPTGKVSNINVRAELGRVLADGGAGGIRQLPRVYHGIVIRTQLEALKARVGTYFPGPSPDMANAIGLSFLVTKVAQIRFPLLIAGHSPRSGGGLGSSGKHVGRIEEQLALPSDTAANWNVMIPFFWSGPTIYAQSAYMAVTKLFGREFYRPNWAKLYAICFVYQSAYLKETFECVIGCRHHRVRLGLNVLFHVAVMVVRRAISFINNFLVFSTKKTTLRADHIGGAIALVRNHTSKDALRLTICELTDVAGKADKSA